MQFTFLLFKVKRLENLLSKCKDTIKNNKEKTIVLNQEKDELQQQVNNLRQQVESSKVRDSYFEYVIIVRLLYTY